MKVLFLDIDGVLNTRPGSLDTDKVELLRGILDQTGARVVLSSAWRASSHSLDRVKCMLADIGHALLDVTPELTEPIGGLWRGVPRWVEIKAWADQHPDVKRFAILDDIADMGTLQPFLVQTDSETGLTEEIAAKVVGALTPARR